MAFHQHATVCPQHRNCTAIICETDDTVEHDGAVVHPAGSVVWTSCAPSHLDPQGRVNPDHAFHGGADEATTTRLHDAARRRGLILDAT